MKYDEKSIDKKNRLEIEDTGNCSLFFKITFIILLFSVLLFFLFFFHFGGYTPDIITFNHSTVFLNKGIKKPQIDERNYRVIRLANDLEVLLISDPKTSTCAASMAVGVGSYYDEDVNGLAHFFEHMLFLVINY